MTSLHDDLSSRTRGSMAENAIRLLALAALLWSFGGLLCLYWITNPQPKKFMPLVMRESDSEASRLAAIESWQTHFIPADTKWLCGVPSPLSDCKLDANLSKIPRSSWFRAIDPAVTNTFKARLYDLNVGVEKFCRDYWQQVWNTLESLIATALASVVCFAYPRILPSCILLVIAGLATFIQLNRWSSNSTIEPLLWILPIFCTSTAAFFLALYRWWVAPASAEVTNDWNKLWLGLLLLGIGIGAFAALIAWGGRVRTSGLGGLGLCVGWGVYLIAVHGWRLIRSLFSKTKPSFQCDSSQIGLP